MRKILTMVAIAVLALAPLAGDAQTQRRPAQQNQQRQPPRPPPPRPPLGVTADTTARQAIVLDVSADMVLFERAADERMAPSSMSKLMTAYVVFEALRANRARLTDEVTISTRARAMGGSRMFVEVGQRVRIEDLIRGMIIQSGNDACVALAEAISGSEEAFVELMNQTARRLGLEASQFRNSSGWPDPDHYMTARDLARLSRRLIADFPEYFTYYSERSFTYNQITQANRNPLLGRIAGVDGMKTGHTDAGGYGLTATTLRDGRRVIVVVNGLPSMRARAEESERLIDWAYREFQSYALLREGDAVERADVWMGLAPNVPLVAGRGLTMTLPRRLREQVTMTASFNNPVAAPVARGQEIGQLTIAVPGSEPRTVPLLAGEAVARLGLFDRVGANLGALLGRGR